MPKRKTWVWVGVGSAALLTAVAAAGVVTYRRRKKAKELTLVDLTVPPPPRPTRTTPSEVLDAEICTQWKTGNHRPRWRPALFDRVNEALAVAMTTIDPQWRNEAQRGRKAFQIARTALGSMCPSVPLPRDEAEVEELSQRFYWDELWGRLYASSINMLADYGPS